MQSSARKPQVRTISSQLDANKDQRLSRKEVLVRCRADRRYADLLKLPPHVREADGTFARFTQCFMEMNTSRTGYVTENELAEYLGIPPAVRKAASGAQRGEAASARDAEDVDR